jgi:pSer/pThr/pTyr-binding forkhead associated (FHA) protein
VRFALHVLRSLSGGPERYDPRGDAVIIGGSGAVSLPGERFCHPREALLSWENGRLWLDDLEGGNGVFLRIRSPVAMRAGGEFVVGDQLLRLERNPEFDDGPGEGPTYFLSSLKSHSAFRITQILEGGALGACRMARENLLQVGSALEYANDLVLADDPLVAAYHCVVEEQADEFVLTDLGAKSGVFVRVTGRQALAQGDELLVGRTRLLVDLVDLLDLRGSTSAV